MKKIPKGQALELIAKLEAAGLNREIAQLIITAPDNRLAKKMLDTISPEAIKVEKEENRVDLAARFDKISEFVFTVPKDYSLKSFHAKHKDLFESFDSNLTDDNFKLSQPLQYGQTKMASIYRLNQKTSGWDCLTFANMRGKYLPNAAGLASVWEQNEEFFNRRLWFLGLDSENSLFQSNEVPMIPVLGRNLEAPCFDLMPMTEVLSPGFCVVVFN